MKKKLLAALFAVLLLLCLVLPASADVEICDCGKEIDEEFNCVGCHCNYKFCTCETCLCGAKITRTYNDDGTVISALCETCGHACAECTCKDTAYYENVNALRNGRNKLGQPMPVSIVFPILVLIVPFAAFLLLFFLVYRKPERRSGDECSFDFSSLLQSGSDKDGYLNLKERLEECKKNPTRQNLLAAKEICKKKNELFPSVLSDERWQELAKRNNEICQILNRTGYRGNPDLAGMQWDGKAQRYLPNTAVTEETVGESLVRWETGSGLFALHELVNSVTPEDENRLFEPNLSAFTGRLDRPDSLPLPEDPAALAPVLSRMTGTDSSEGVTLAASIGDVVQEKAPLPVQAPTAFSQTRFY